MGKIPGKKQSNAAESNVASIVHGERVVYDSEWVRVGLADITQPSGGRFEHHTVQFRPVAMGVVFDAYREHVLLAWRHRFAPDVWGWEVPGGIIEEGETPREAVIRELREETGYEADRVSHLITFEPAVGMLRNANHLFLMEEVKRVSEPTERDEGRFEWVPYAEVPSLITGGKVTNSGALIGLLHLLAFP